MSTFGKATTLALLVAAAGGLASCSSQPPDRVEEVTLASGSVCTVEWTLEPRANAGRATEVAQQALAGATIKEQDLRNWEATLREEYVAEFGDPDSAKEAEFERLAPVEVVREQVREALAAHGFPDSPERLVDVRGSTDCG
ncbi:hypothetical protein [Microbacterium sp. SSM24]|uniref:hypothetical protein n=1 Tax=Microbacterium sp. SSM24 TaxID=2991714 RepID=UPI0022279952|nr:hypothetical protein [Microbacterium sp. SSM24]MCW3493021.1 hypothetical protein [Microbacterium sp. SSM24]